MEEKNELSASSEVSPVLELAAIKQLQEILGEEATVLLPSLIDSFFQDAPRLLDEAQAALAQGQAVELRRAAHSLKSNSATFGAKELAKVAQELEDKARDGGLGGASELIKRARGEFARARAPLEEVQKGLSK